MVNLTDSERRKMIDYLRWEATNEDGLAKEMAKHMGDDSVIVKRRRSIAAAYMFVAEREDSWESQTIADTGEKE